MSSCSIWVAACTGPTANSATGSAANSACVNTVLFISLSSAATGQPVQQDRFRPAGGPRMHTGPACALPNTPAARSEIGAARHVVRHELVVEPGVGVAAEGLVFHVPVAVV